MTSASYRAHTEPLFKALKLLTFSDLYEYSIVKLMFKVKKGLTPNCLNDLFIENNQLHHYLTRQRNALHVPICRTDLMTRTFRHKGVQLWNTFIDKLDNNCSFALYKRRLKHYLMDR